MDDTPRQMRLSGAVRGAVIGYGIAAYFWFFPQAGAASGVVKMLLAGIGLQIVAFVLRRLVVRYERANGLEGQVTPQAMYIFEMIADGVTVLLFALSTYLGVVGHMAEI